MESQKNREVKIRSRIARAEVSLGRRQIGEYYPAKNKASSINHHQRFQPEPIFRGIKRSLGRSEKLVDIRRAKVEVYSCESSRGRKVRGQHSHRSASIVGKASRADFSQQI